MKFSNLRKYQYVQRDKFGKSAMVDFYHLLRSVYPQRRIFVIQDNSNFYYSQQVLAPAQELDIHPVYLPTYASWLNPIEKLALVESRHLTWSHNRTNVLIFEL